MKFQYRITLIYLLAGFLWIHLSDAILVDLFPEEETLSMYQTLKGSLFILVTGSILYVFVRNYVRHQNNIKKELRTSRERYKALYDNAPLAFQSLDGKGIFLDINPEWSRVMGYPREDVIGRWFGEFIHPDDLPAFKKKFKEFEREGCVEEVIFRMRKSNGEYATVSYTGRAPETTGDGIIQTFCTFKDISGEAQARQELSEREKALVKALEKARESERLKSAFLANISHEVRTPMNGIIGFAEILNQEGIDKEKQSHFQEYIRKSGERLLETINNIIAASELESGQVKTEKSIVDVAQSISFLHKIYQAEAEKKGLEFRLRTTICSKGIHLFTDRKKLESILNNLVQNAIKFTNQGYVELGCSKADDKVIFHVRDTGIGIAGNMKDKIFERFTQGDTDISRPYEGSGLGLSLAKAYAELLGGEILLSSEVNKGSTFKLVLPESLLTTPQADPEVLSMTPAPLSEEKLVIVAEDDDTSFQYLEILLSSENLKVLRAKDGYEAIEAVEEYPEAALLLMDLKMPKLDGITATQRIREKDITLPIIAQTAYAMSGDREKALKCGCNDYISKPIERTELIQKIRAALSN